MRHSRTFAGLTLAAVVVAAPVEARAQAPVERPATHTVKKGDTLWDLAQLYLSDPFQWPQIYQLNKEKIKDPHWIYPDQVFAIPGGTAAAQPAADPSMAAEPRRSSGSGSGMTIFNPASRRPPAQNRDVLLARAAHTAVRRGDYEAAPFMWKEGGPTEGGKIIASAEVMGTPINAGFRPIGYRETALLQLPAGLTADSGRRLMLYRLGPVIPNQGQVVVPTGIAEVTSVVSAGQVRAMIMTKFEDVFAGHGVMALDSLTMPLNVFPSRVEFGLSTRVVWIHMKPQLPSEGHHLILAATQAQGLVTGDQVSIRLPRPSEAGEEEVAVAQVTRVTTWGVSAILLDVSNAGVAPGVRAQVSAKMP